MKMTVHLLACLLAVALADHIDPTQIEKYDDKVRTYTLDVPGKDPITIIENIDDAHAWKEISLNPKEADYKNLVTHIIHDIGESRPRCYGPSCQEGFRDEGFKDNNEELEDFEDYMLAAEKLKDYSDDTKFPYKDRLQAITALAAELKKKKIKPNRYHNIQSDEESDDNGKVYTSWNRLKVKQHKHPFDDKDGWVSLEPVAWSSSKISKWKPNIKKQKPNYWMEDDERYPSSTEDDRFTNIASSFNNHNQQNTNFDSYNYQQKKPSLSRPTYINNKLHVPTDFGSEIPSRPTWTKPHQTVSHLSWSPDEGRRPHKPNCDSNDHHHSEDTVYYGISDSLVTDPRPSNFPYEYEALHQSTITKRPYKRPTEVVYAGSDYEDDRSRPPYGDGQWVLLSTTKGYRDKKRQRSLNLPPADRNDVASVTSHQSVALTVLPVDNAHTNMTTSHGGLLEVEKSFKTVEESKRDLDKKFDLEVSASNTRPKNTRVFRRKVMTNASPDSSTLLAAVGAGMVPATMAMVVPMMLGRRRRRRAIDIAPVLHLDNILRYY